MILNEIKNKVFSESIKFLKMTSPGKEKNNK